MSTAILPDAPVRDSGHSTGMDLNVVLENIERRLLIRELSADEASRLAKRPDAIRNLRRKVASGAKGSMRFDTLAALAAVLKTTPDDLMVPEKDIEAPPADAREYIVAQIDLLQRQLAAIDERKFTGQKLRKRNNR